MAIARNVSGEILQGTDLKIRIAILKSTDPLIYVWEEEHIVKTDDFGQFKLIVGDPAAVWTEPPGGIEKFSDIDWNIQPLYIRTSILIGEVWEVMGKDSQLFSVPYSLVSQNLSGADKLSVTGTTTNMDEALFEVKNHLNQTVFAVYGDGVRMYVGDRTAKGAKGGFAIGEFGAKGKADIQEYFTITPYEARINMNPPPPAKAPKGGFAIGEFGAKGGIIPTSFMDVTPKNYFIGHESGTLITDGVYNSTLGYQAGKNLTSGSSNTIMGHLAGFSTNSGIRNIIIGEEAGYALSSGTANTIIGFQAGISHTTQLYNVMIGNAAGYHLNNPGWAGSFNTFLGTSAGYAIRNSRDNTFLGTNAGLFLDNGTGNTFVGTDAGRSGGDVDPWVPRAFTADYNNFLGYRAGYNITTGDYNVAFGFEAGYQNQAGSHNVFIGHQAGYSETGDNKLYISNSSTNNIIYGDFSTGNIGIGTTTLTRKLNVSGDAGVSGNLTAGSITAPLTGTVTGNVNGNLSGNVTGNVNGMAMGKVYLNANGNIATAYGTNFTLYWNKTTGEISIINSHPTDFCDYWFQTQKGSTTAGNASGIPGATTTPIIMGTNTNGYGFEIHFGIADGQEGWCSVWLQYANGSLVGHYIKY